MELYEQLAADLCNITGFELGAFFTPSFTQFTGMISRQGSSLTENILEEVYRQCVSIMQRSLEVVLFKSTSPTAMVYQSFAMKTGVKTDEISD